MSKRRVRRKRRARVNILPLILVGAVIAGVITVVMSVNLKGADKEPPTEEIHITETPLSENTEPVTEQEAKLGDNGNSKGYMQIYERWHTERMEAEGVTDLFNPYQNIRVGLNCLREIQDKYLASSGENCVLMVYNMGESTAKKLWAKDIYSSAYSREVITRAQELRQELTQE